MRPPDYSTSEFGPPRQQHPSNDRLTEKDEKMPQVNQTPVENGSGVQWTLGEEVEDSDIFPHENGTALPPAAPSDGQGGLTVAERNALMEKRKRLK